MHVENAAGSTESGPALVSIAETARLEMQQDAVGIWVFGPPMARYLVEKRSTLDSPDWFPIERIQMPASGRPFRVRTWIGYHEPTAFFRAVLLP